ncbi:MAG: tRNA (guanosine(46)-N(7))-methyltransferase TrmB [Bacteriovoracia bacterium]
MESKERTPDPFKPLRAANPSVADPAYRYYPSKNPYFNKLKGLSDKVFIENTAEARRGKWRELFPETCARAEALGRRPEVHVEMGCNGGHVLLEWATRDPANIYVGLDWKFKQIFMAHQKAERRGLKNVAVMRSHAERLPFIFGEGEIDRLYLFFPDPWEKKAQLHKRLVTADWLRAIAPSVRAKGTFELRTDHPGYFEAMIGAAQGAADTWEVVEFTRDRHANRADAGSLTMPEVTLFERLFIKDGIPIQKMVLRRAGLTEK